MQIVRTIVWVVILAALLIFTAFNWNPVEVQIWTNIVLETKIPALVIVGSRSERHQDARTTHRREFRERRGARTTEDDL